MAPKHITQEQADRIIAIDALQRRRVDTQKLAAIAYEVHQNRIFVPGYETARPDLSFINPLSVLFRPTGPNAFTGPLPPPANAKEKMERAAADTLERFEDTNYRYREMAADVLVNGTVIAGTIAFPGVGGAAAAAGAQIMWPVVKSLAKESPEYVKAHTPNLQAEFTTEWLAWAYDQVRKETDEGKILEPYFAKLSDVNPRIDFSTLTPVVAARAQLEAAAATETSEAALTHLVASSKVQSMLVDAVKEIAEDIKDKKARAAKAATRAARVTTIENVQGTLQMAGYVMEIAGDRKGARIAAGLADSAGKVANLVENVAGMAPMMLVSGYVGVAIALVSLFATQNDDGPPYAEIFDMLQEILKQLEELRTDILDTLGKLDARLGNMLIRNIYISETIRNDTGLVLDRINELQRMLREAVEQVDRWGALNVKVVLQTEDAECIRSSGEMEPVPPHDFILCRTRYVTRATDTARDLAFAASYDNLRKALGLGDIVRPLPDPQIWYDAVSKFLLLAAQFPRFVSEIQYNARTKESPTIDPMIQAGNDFLSFRDQIAARWDNGRPQFEPAGLRRLLEWGVELRRQLARSIARQLENPGAPIRIAGQGLPPINQDYDFEFLRTGNVSYEEKVRTKLLSVKHVQMTFSGGRSGHDFWLDQDGVNRTWPAQFAAQLGVGDIRKRIDDAIAGTPARDLFLDRSILMSIPPALLLLEQAQVKGAKVYCKISKFDIEELDMPNPRQGQAVVTLAIKLDFQYIGDDKSPMVPVGEYSLRHVIPLTPFNLFYDRETRGAALVQRVWGGLRGQLGTLVRSAKIDDEGLAHANQMLMSFLQKTQDDIVSKAASADQELTIERNRRDLINATSIGLNSHLAVVQELQALLSSSAFPTAKQVVTRMVRRGDSLQDVEHDLDESLERANELIQEIGESPDFLPRPGLIEHRLAALERCKQIRAGAIAQSNA